MMETDLILIISGTPVRLYQALMGRKLHGAVAKQRHTITLDAEVVANVIEFGNRNRITGLSGAIERLAEMKSSTIVVRVSNIQPPSRAVSTRTMLMASVLPFEEYPMCGSHRSYFKVAGRFIDIGFDEHNGETMRFAAKQRVHAIAIVPSVTNRDPRVVDLIGFGKLLRRWAKKSPVRKTGEKKPGRSPTGDPSNNTPSGLWGQANVLSCGPAESYEWLGGTPRPASRSRSFFSALIVSSNSVTRAAKCSICIACSRLVLPQNGQGSGSVLIVVEEDFHAAKEHPAHHRQEPPTIAPGVVADNRHQHGQHDDRDLHGDSHGNPPAEEHQPDPPPNLAIHAAPPSFAGVASSSGSEYSVTFISTSRPYSFVGIFDCDERTFPFATSFATRA